MKTFALAGNPNCGKTTLFNALTGSSAHVGNWPGVTVERREGVYKGGAENVKIVDLPGIYSLSPYTPEEIISREFILEEQLCGIINIVDATNLERNLYLTTQLLEIDVPVIVALNMMDEVEKSGDKIDIGALEKALGVPVVGISALKNSGIKALMERAARMPSKRAGSTVLGGALKKPLEVACAYYKRENVRSPLFHAVKLLEKDEAELSRKGAREALGACAATDAEAEIADGRYRYISEKLSCAKACAKRGLLTRSDKADRALTHRVWAIPIFAVVLFLVFHLTFSENLFFLNGFTEKQGWMPALEELNLCNADGDAKNFGVELLSVFYDGTLYSPGVMLTNLVNLFLNNISDGVIALMERGGAAEWATGLVGDGVLGGIFAVLGFLPQMLTLLLFFSVLEDTGYMARIVFVLDRIFRRFGLSGRAFMPMIMGFGCSIPAMVNTRTLSDEKERTATVRVIPFFSCGAKLPVLTAVAGGIVSYFGVGNADAITYGMYLFGICAAIICVLLMRSSTLKGEAPPFIMELPAYRATGFKNLMLHLWDKAKHFVKKAFTVIFASTVIIWLLSHFSPSWHYLPDERIDESVLASLGMLIQPLFTPLGFGSQLSGCGWVFAVAALTGLVAKENVIATFGALAACLAGMSVTGGADGLSADADGVASAVAMIEATGITIPALIAFIAFNMTTVPCFAACATAKAELPRGKFRYTLLFWLAASYASAALIYTVGSFWWTLAIWLAIAAAAVTLIILRNTGKFDITKIFRRRNKNKEG